LVVYLAPIANFLVEHGGKGNYPKRICVTSDTSQYKGLQNTDYP
jgi:hypothetical protein